MVKIKNNKKGSLFDIFYISIVLLFFAVIVLVGLKFATSFKDNIIGTGVLDSTGEQALTRTVNNYTNSINYGYLFLAIFLCIIVLILASMVRVHPIFLVLFLIGWFFLIYLCAIFSNVYQYMAEDTNLASTANQLNIITGIMNILPWLVAVFGILLMWIMYKISSQNG